MEIPGCNGLHRAVETDTERDSNEQNRILRSDVTTANTPTSLSPSRAGKIKSPDPFILTDFPSVELEDNPNRQGCSQNRYTINVLAVILIKKIIHIYVCI